MIAHGRAPAVVRLAASRGKDSYTKITHAYLNRSAARAEQIGTSASIDDDEIATVTVLGALAATLKHKERKRR